MNTFFSPPVSLEPQSGRMRPAALLKDMRRRLDRRALAYTGLIGLFFATYHALASLGDPLRVHSLQFFLAVQVPIHVGGAYFLLLALKGGDSAVALGARPFYAYLGTLASAAVLFALLQWKIRHWLDIPTPFDRPDFPRAVRLGQLYNMVLRVFQYGGVIAFVYIQRRLAVASFHQLQGARLQRSEVESAIVRSRLQAMQARAEPRLLSDTLGQVRTLYQVRPQAADALLEKLIVYLRAASPQLRESSSTVERESRLAQAYFDMLGSGRELRCHLTAEADVTQASLPPMLLLPLMVHALGRSGPAPAPATIHLHASAIGRALRLVVDVSGVPATDAAAIAASAIPLDLKERLETLYGARAVLGSEVLEASASRVRVRSFLTIPLEPGVPAGPSRA